LYVSLSFLGRYLQSHAISSRGITKLANILYASELQRRLIAAGSRITVISLNPGAADTLSDKPPLHNYKFIIKPIVFLFFSHPDKGAYTSVFAAASEEVARKHEKYRGAYLTPVGRVTEPTKVAGNEGLAKELLDSVETFLQEKGM